MKTKKRSGFTIIEIAMVMVILGIMSALALTKYQQTVAANTLEKAANGLYLELRSLRPLAFKYDAIVKARFNTSASQCTVWVDTSNEEGVRKYKQLRLYQVAVPVKFGVPPSSPIQWKFFSPNNAWKDSLCVEPDSRGEYYEGAIYLYNPKLAKTIYCIGITTLQQSIELHKWNGKKWTTTPL